MNWSQMMNINLNSKNGKAIDRLFRKSTFSKLNAREIAKLETLLNETGDFDTGEIAYVINYISS